LPLRQAVGSCHRWRDRNAVPLTPARDHQAFKCHLGRYRGGRSKDLVMEQFDASSIRPSRTAKG
jgi:hypothetical protein